VVPSSPTRCRRKTPLSKGTPWPSTTTWDNQKHSTVSLEGCSPGLSQQCRKDHAQNFRNVVHPWPAPVCKIWSGSAAICQIYSWKIDFLDLQSVYNIGKSLLCIIDFLVVGPVLLGSLGYRYELVYICQNYHKYNSGTFFSGSLCI